MVMREYFLDSMSYILALGCAKYFPNATLISNCSPKPYAP